VHGQDEHRDAREFRHDHFRQLDSVRPLQSQIRDNQMRLHFPDDIHPFARAARLPANRETVIRIQELNEPMPE